MSRPTAVTHAIDDAGGGGGGSAEPPAADARAEEEDDKDDELEAENDDEGGGDASDGGPRIPAATMTAGAQPQPQPRQQQPLRRSRRARASFRLTAPRRSHPSRELASLEARAEDAQRAVRALENRNDRLRAEARFLADELGSLSFLHRVDAAASAASAGPVAAAAAGAAAAERSYRRASPAAFSDAILRVYSLQQREGGVWGAHDGSLGAESGGGGGFGKNENKPLLPAAANAAAAAASAPHSTAMEASPLFCGSVLGQLGRCPNEAATALAERVAGRAAARPDLGPPPSLSSVGGAGGQQEQQQQQQQQPQHPYQQPLLRLETAIALWRSLATRAALLLRRLQVCAEVAEDDDDDDGGGGSGCGGAAATPAAAGLEAEVTSIAVECVVLITTMLKHHPSVLDELVLHRLDDERSPPVRHDEHALEARLAKAAVRAAKFTPEQLQALRSAFRTFRRNMAGPTRLWREAALGLAGGGGGAAADEEGAPAAAAADDDGAPSSELLLARLERCVAACSLHRVLLTSRMYSIVTPRQFCSLLVDCYPFMMRPAPMAAAFQEEEEEEGGEEEWARGRGEALA